MTRLSLLPTGRGLLGGSRPISKKLSNSTATTMDSISSRSVHDEHEDTSTHDVNVFLIHSGDGDSTTQSPMLLQQQQQQQQQSAQSSEKKRERKRLRKQQEKSVCTKQTLSHMAVEVSEQALNREKLRAMRLLRASDPTRKGPTTTSTTTIKERRATTGGNNMTDDSHNDNDNDNDSSNLLLMDELQLHGASIRSELTMLDDYGDLGDEMEYSHTTFTCDETLILMFYGTIHDMESCTATPTNKSNNMSMYSIRRHGSRSNKMRLPWMIVLVFLMGIQETLGFVVLERVSPPRVPGLRLPEQGRFEGRNTGFLHRREKRLTTKLNGEEDPQPLSFLDYFRKAGDKFKARPGTYLLIPCIAALVGWFTNWLAVQMIFYPIKFQGIPIYIRDEVPLGLLGWQGIVPCKTRKMSEAMVNMVTTQLLTVKDAFARLDPSELAKRLAPEVPKLGEEVLNDILPHKWMVQIPRAVFFGLPGVSQRILQYFNFHFLKSLSKDMIANIDSYFDIQRCVQGQMLQDRSLLGQLFKRCGQKELDFLTNSGLWFGFLLGLIQMAVALFFENPWTLSIGGLIVGLATNWLALKWIFEPVNPTKFGPFILQGQFLRRQKEVAAEFSKFFASRILTSHQVWNSILNDPTTSPSFYALFARHFISFANRVTGCLRINVEPEVVQMATSRAMKKLPQHIPVLHSYIDGALGLEDTLRVKMEHMTSSQFERVLHPIFEEDEATLIAAGAVLGFAAGLIQQGIETGAIKIPDIWSPIQKKIAPYLEYPRSRMGAFFTKANSRRKRLQARIRNIRVFSRVKSTLSGDNERTTDDDMGSNNGASDDSQDNSNGKR